MTEVAEKIKQISPKGSEIVLTGYEKAVRVGELRGVHERSIKSAIVLINLGFDNETIIKVTDLGISQITELRELVEQGITIDEIITRYSST